ncbi:F-box domain protein [Geosmithia morbida]|uniref:F-box domain protein n=1 Tax=Geosmithia morbida TaxID=1094350 RepID=A0A9P4Z3C9_9HYPO|nr:F-box domain protein [Geosmithia morbida]KAF4126955.1 F-box domain protein [Geosmithia morbida]
MQTFTPRAWDGSSQSDLPKVGPQGMLTSIVLTDKGDNADDSHLNQGLTALPVELIHHIYFFLSPADFDSARKTCHALLSTAVNGHVLRRMLKRGGWWRSVSGMLSRPDEATGQQYDENDLAVMSRWLSRECALCSTAAGAFSEVGLTDFGQLAPALRHGMPHDCAAFTVSLYGRFVLAALGEAVYVYELDHVCARDHRRRTALPRRREGLPLGMLRPVTLIICDRQVISCSMDTSKGRNSVAILMQGRLGFVCDVSPRRLGIPVSDSCASTWPVLAASEAGQHTEAEASRTCICRVEPATRAPAAETSAASVYRSICFPDDPPRSVALHPQRHCVAFGCSGGVELYWTDADIDMPKRLRLIGSAMALESPAESFGNIVNGLNPTIFGSRTVSTVPLAGLSSAEMAGAGQTAQTTAPTRNSADRAGQPQSQLPSMTSRNAYHYRAVPLSDGHHILFTDPWSGNLCLGTDAPAGSLTRLVRKVWFSPPAAAASSAPILYAAGADLSHGVRVVATFPVRKGGHDSCCRRFGIGLHAPLAASGVDGVRAPQNQSGTARNRDSSVRNRGGTIPRHDDGGRNQTPVHGARDPSDVGRNQAADVSGDQIIVFYTIPPDTFHDINTRGSPASQDRLGTWRATEDAEELPDWAPWMARGTLGGMGEPLGHQQRDYHSNSDLPISIAGQPVAVCSSLVEVSLKAWPVVAIWAFSAEGWSRTWSLATASQMERTVSAVQRDGSLRRAGPDDDDQLDGEDDDDDDDKTANSASAPAVVDDAADKSGPTPAPFDGPSCTQIAGPSCHQQVLPAAGGPASQISRGGIRRAAGLDVADGRADGIVRIDVELR